MIKFKNFIVINFFLIIILVSTKSFSENHNALEVLELIQKDLKTLEKAVYSGSLNDSISSNSKIKLHMFKCVSLLNEVLWSMVAEISSKKVFDFVSYTNNMLKRYEKQFDYYNSLRVSI